MPTNLQNNCSNSVSPLPWTTVFQKLHICNLTLLHYCLWIVLNNSNCTHYSHFHRVVPQSSNNATLTISQFYTLYLDLKVLLPVCGDDGITYDNICLMKLESCMDGVEIKLAHEGPCRYRIYDMEYSPSKLHWIALNIDKNLWIPKLTIFHNLHFAMIPYCSRLL